MSLVSRRPGVFTALAALVMAFARVYIAAHYRHDVVVGLLGGAVVSLIGIVPVRGLLQRLVVACERTRLRPALTTPQ